MSANDSNWILATIIAGAGFVVTLIGGVIARDRAMTRLISDGDDELHSRLNRARDEFNKELTLLRSDFTSYKLEVAREYASHTHLKEVEDRLTRALDKLDSRLADMPKLFAEEVARAIRAANGDSVNDRRT